MAMNDRGAAIRGVAGALMLLCVALWSASVSAQTAPAPPAAPPSPPSSEAMVYLSVSSLVNVAVGTLITGGVVSGTAIAVVNSVSGWALYQLNNVVWTELFPKEPPKLTPTFLVANALRVVGVGYLFTQSAGAAIGYWLLSAAGEVVSFSLTNRIAGAPATGSR